MEVKDVIFKSAILVILFLVDVYGHSYLVDVSFHYIGQWGHLSSLV